VAKNLLNDIDKVLIDEETLQARIQELAQQIEDDYEDIDNLLIVCILKGAYVFTADFSRLLKRPHQVDFMAVSSYGGATKSSGVVRIVKDLKISLENQHVLILEDIIDSGHTLAYLSDLLKTRNPASFKICTLLNKPSRREADIPVDYIGFDIPDEFVVGYGLDYDEVYRNLPFVGILKPSVFA